MEKTLKVLNKLSFLAQAIDKDKAPTIGYVIPLEIAIEIINNISKTEWKYPEKNEYPELQMNTVFLGVKFKDGKYITFPILWHFQQKYFTNMLLNKIELIAWCELPVFNKA